MKIPVLILLLWALQLAGQDTSSCPVHKNESQHQVDVEKHGDEAMGFPHDRTTHHFLLSPEGGAIEVIVTDTEDTANLQAVRSHLKHVVSMFSNGDFSVPMFVHSQIPPGVSEMKDRRMDIAYTFEE